VVLERQRLRKLFHVEQSPANGKPLASNVGSCLVSIDCTCVIYEANVPCYSERGRDEISGVEQPHQRVGFRHFCPRLSFCHCRPGICCCLISGISHFQRGCPGLEMWGTLTLRCRLRERVRPGPPARYWWFFFHSSYEMRGMLMNASRVRT